MTEAEKELIELKLDGLGELFEVKLKASEEVICNKMTAIEEKFTVTKQTINEHIAWHNNLNKKIVGYTVKGVLLVLLITVITTFILGFKDGILTSAIVKMIG